MALVTVKPKFQVTIPAKLRERMNLREGDLLDATLVEGGILLRPKTVVDRKAVAAEAKAILDSIVPTPEDARRTEDEIMADVIADIAKHRTEQRKRRRR